MKILKNILFSALSLLLIININIVSYALNTRISFSDPTTKAMEEFEVRLKITSLDGIRLGNANLMLKYDPAMIEFIGGANVEGGAGAIRVKTLSEASTEWIYNIKFKALASGETSISINSEEVYDLDGKLATISKKGQAKITIEPSDNLIEESEETVEEVVEESQDFEEVHSEEDIEGTKLVVQGKKIYVLELKEGIDIPNELKETSIEVNGTRVKAFVDKTVDKKEYVVVYAKNENNEEGFYSYDLGEKTIQRYFTGERLKDLESKHEKLSKDFKFRTLIMYALFVALFVLILFIILLIALLKPKKKFKENTDLLDSMKTNQLTGDFIDEIEEVEYNKKEDVNLTKSDKENEEKINKVEEDDLDDDFLEIEL